MQDFRVSGREMNRLAEELKTVQENIDSSYERIANLVQRIDTEDKWKGKQRDTFLAYIELMEQYHRSFTDNSEENPIKQALEGLKELGENVDGFYTDFSEYKKVEGLR